MTNTSFSVSQPDMIVMVARANGTVDSAFMLDGSSSRQTIHIHTSQQWSIYAGSSEPRAGSIDFEPHIFTAFYNGASSVLWVDGTSTIASNPGTAALTGIIVGARTGGTLPFKGDIAEVLVISSASASDRSAVEGYLAHKWGMANRLPSNHSYRSVSLTQAPIVSTDATNSSGAGTYYVRPSGAASTKYSFAYVDGFQMWAWDKPLT